jgi:hypothetical protein
MTATTHPTKEAVRKFMRKRQVEHKPPPSPEQIKRELGWHLVEAERRLAK